jgi:hypothetical protein
MHHRTTQRQHKWQGNAPSSAAPAPAAEATVATTPALGRPESRWQQQQPGGVDHQHNLQRKQHEEAIGDA